MKSRFLAMGLLFTLVIGAGAGLLLAAGPDPTQPYIESISYGGSGCPNGSVAQSISDDRQRFTLIFDRYVASTGPGVPATDARKDCQININLRAPNGTGNTHLNLQYRGYAQLAAASTGEQQADYYLASTPHKPGGGGSGKFNGPVAKDYVQSDTIPLQLQKVDTGAPCGFRVPFNIKSSIRIVGPPSVPGQLTTDSIDGQIKVTGKPKANAGC
jgi:hypothetical protein